MKDNSPDRKLPGDIGKPAYSQGFRRGTFASEFGYRRSALINHSDANPKARPIFTFAIKEGFTSNARERVRMETGGDLMLSRAKLKQLRDLVPEEVVNKYLDEAISCYKVGAYRMSTVMIWNAVFGSLFHKIENLAGVNDKFRKIADDARYTRGEGASYEQQLKQDLEKAKLLLPEQINYLEELRGWRNGFAHPTDKAITGSKAGYFLEEGITLFLTETSFNAQAVIYGIEGRLRMPAYFPSSTEKGRLSLVRDEMAKVSPQAYHKLVRLVVDLLGAEDEMTSDNARAFLRCCVILQIESLRTAVMRHLFVPRLGTVGGIDDPHSLAMWSIVYSVPSCMQELDPHQQQQLDRKMAQLCETFAKSKKFRSSALNLFSRLARTKPILLDTVLRQTSGWIIRAHADSPKMLDALKRLGYGRGLIVAAMRLRALSPNPSEAMSFYKFADAQAQHLADILNGQECYALLLSLGSRTQEGQVEPLLRRKALEWFQQDQDAAVITARRNCLFNPAEHFHGFEAVPRGEQGRRASAACPP